jgi:hypothetical protein
LNGLNYHLDDTAPDDDAGELALVAARDRFTDLRIIEVLGGFAAVPANTVMVQAATLDGLVARLSAAPPRRRVFPFRFRGHRGRRA